MNMYLYNFIQFPPWYIFIIFFNTTKLYYIIKKNYLIIDISFKKI